MTEEPKNMFGKTIDPVTGYDEEQAEKIKSDDIKPKIEGESPTRAAAERAFAGKAAAEQKEAQRAAERSDVVAPRKGVVQVESLHIRQDHTTTSAEVGGLHYGEEVTILETWSDGKNSWARIGPDQWAAIRYNEETFIEFT